MIVFDKTADPVQVVLSIKDKDKKDPKIKLRALAVEGREKWKKGTNVDGTRQEEFLGLCNTPIYEDDKDCYVTVWATNEFARALEVMKFGNTADLERVQWPMYEEDEEGNRTPLAYEPITYAHPIYDETGSTIIGWRDQEIGR